MQIETLKQTAVVTGLGLALTALSSCTASDPATPDAGGSVGVDSGVTTSPQEACGQYCDAVLAGCTGANQLFSGRDECLAACGGFPTSGKEGDSSGNSVYCRLYHAKATASDPTHCAHASVSGAGICGALCEVYCDYSLKYCSSLYSDRSACLETCANFPAAGHDHDPATGNSVECRIFHASAAADPSHCAHASANGAGVCGDDPCEAYCDQALGNCDGRYALYPDRAACLATCARMPKSASFDAADGNSVQCRTFHAAGPSASDPSSHCAHAGPSGAGVCGEPCEAYCDQVLGNCTGANAVFSTAEECLGACGPFPSGALGATSGDSLECRLFHGSFPASSDPVHCAHAAPVSPGVCEDAPPPRTDVQLSGRVKKLGALLAGRDEGVPTASILAYGVNPSPATNSNSSGDFTLRVPAQGKVTLFVNKTGYFPTYTTVTVASEDLRDLTVDLTETAWLNQVASTHSVALDAPFACRGGAGGQCVYGVIVGKVLDDGTAGNGTPWPVAGVRAGDFQIQSAGAAVSITGPYFLNADGTPNGTADRTLASGQNSSGGLFVVFVEIPQLTGDPSIPVEISAETTGAGGMRYFGPVETSVFRPYGVTWVDLPESGGGQPPPNGEVDFDTEVYPIFLPIAQGGLGCQGCHTNQGGAEPLGGLNLYGGPGVAYESLDPRTHGARVNLTRPEDSTLLKKPLYESSGTQDHPIFAFASTEDAGYQTILQWIRGGASREAVGRPVSFTLDVLPLLGQASANGGAGCVACHDSGNLNLAQGAAAVYREVVEERATDASGTGEQFRINKTGRPEASLMLTNPLAGSGEAHPVKIFNAVTDARYQLLYRWIVEGYRNDGNECGAYCDDVTASCTGANQLYAARADCEAACARLPTTGRVGDLSGDSLQCRQTHLAAAAGDQSHCAHAGETGGGACGTWCDVYCRQSQEICAGANRLYPNSAACEAACATFGTDGQVGDAAGNTVQCRLFHLSAARADVTHCAHAAEDGGGVCQ